MSDKPRSIPPRSEGEIRAYVEGYANAVVDVSKLGLAATAAFAREALICQGPGPWPAREPTDTTRSLGPMNDPERARVLRAARRAGFVHGLTRGGRIPLWLIVSAACFDVALLIWLVAQ